MGYELSHLNDEQLRKQLYAAYNEMRGLSPESPSVKMLKEELYRRGFEQQGIIEIALASLLHRAAA